MSREMDRDTLPRELKALPRERAGPDFTARVLGRLDEERSPAPAPFPPRAWLPALALAALLALAVGVPFALRQAAQEAEPAVAAEAAGHLEELRREQQLLAAELAALKRLTAEPSPVIYLGGDERTDLVVDLASLARRREEARGPEEIRPASFHGAPQR